MRVGSKNVTNFGQPRLDLPQTAINSLGVPGGGTVPKFMSYLCSSFIMLLQMDYLLKTLGVHKRLTLASSRCRHRHDRWVEMYVEVWMIILKRLWRKLNADQRYFLRLIFCMCTLQWTIEGLNDIAGRWNVSFLFLVCTFCIKMERLIWWPNKAIRIDTVFFPFKIMKVSHFQNNTILVLHFSSFDCLTSPIIFIKMWWGFDIIHGNVQMG